MIVLGIDPSLRGSGFALCERDGETYRCIEHDVVKNPHCLSPVECLGEIYRATERFLEKKPECASVESTIYVQNVKTSISLAMARGAILACLAVHGVPVKEYTPCEIKESILSGSATKEQVALMVKEIFGLPFALGFDESDACAAAYRVLKGEDVSGCDEFFQRKKRKR